MKERTVNKPKKEKVFSKKVVVQKIIDYVFQQYCDDEEIAILAQHYYAAEKRIAERKKKKSDTKASKSQDKCHDKFYKISKEVRDFLEPLVDAEYYKDKYIPNVDAAIIYQAMYELNTRVHQQLEEQILEDIKSGKIK